MAELDVDAAPETSLRDVMARFTTGVTVLTTPGDAGHGMTANAFTSLSVDPPLVLCCVVRDSRMHEAMTAGGAFAVSILASGQLDAARWFADSDRPSGAEQFHTVEHRLAPFSGAPVLEAASGWLDCEIEAIHPGGDHEIVIGAVRAAGVDDDAPTSLLFQGGAFHLFSATPTEPPASRAA